MYQVIMIVPIADYEDVKALSLALGNPDGEFGVKLSSDGSEPHTHMALHTRWSEARLDIWNNKALTIPEDYTAQQVSEIMDTIDVHSASLSQGFKSSELKAFWKATLADVGLRRLEAVTI